MPNWLSFPHKSWSQVGTLLSGFGAGEGTYGASYAIDQTVGPFLNGSVSASIRLAGDSPLYGAGVVARADELRSFVAFYIVNDEKLANLYNVRMAAFKLGKLCHLVGLKQPIEIPDREYRLHLQFFSGEMVGQVDAGAAHYTLQRIIPERPFAGFCGVVRFYHASALARAALIEEMSTRPILPKAPDESRKHPFCVFLSYASADKDIVQQITSRFREASIPYWVDYEQITFGDSIVAKIELGLRESKFVVACISKNQSKSGWCRAEYGAILYREFSGDTARRVIPVSLDGSTDTTAIPFLLSDKLRADFADEVNFSQFISFLKK